MFTGALCVYSSHKNIIAHYFCTHIEATMHLERSGWPKPRNRRVVGCNRRVVGYAELTDESSVSIIGRKLDHKKSINVFARLKYSLVHGSNGLSTLSDAPVPPTAGVLQKPPKPKWEPFICGGFHILASWNITFRGYLPTYPQGNITESLHLGGYLPTYPQDC